MRFYKISFLLFALALSCQNTDSRKKIPEDCSSRKKSGDCDKVSQSDADVVAGLSVVIGSSIAPDSSRSTALQVYKLGSNKAPENRSFHSAALSATDMLIFGGNSADGVSLSTGSLFNLKTNQWTPIANPPPEFEPRTHAFSAWTGSQFIFFGGVKNYRDNSTNSIRATSLISGALYNPESRTWTLLPSTDAPPILEKSAVAFLNGSLFIWGGYSLNSGEAYPKKGYIFNLKTNSWKTIPTTQAPAGRKNAAVSVRENAIDIWGGVGFDSNILSDGASFNVISEAWTPILSRNESLPGRQKASGISVAGKSFFWGGESLLGECPSDLGLLELNQESPALLRLPTLQGPKGRSHGLFASLGAQLFVWGGSCQTQLKDEFVGDGFTFDTIKNTWDAFKIGDSPESRKGLSAVGDGKILIFWGGENKSNYHFNDGYIIN